MYTSPPSGYELSRHAAERYALLTAVKEQRAQKRRSSRSEARRRGRPPTAAIHD